MSWFEDQLRERKTLDDETLQEAYAAIINAVEGQEFSFEESEEALEMILSFYHMGKVTLPENIAEEEKLSTFCRLSGLMERPVRLESGWYKNAFGAFLCQKKDGETVAAVPDALGHYSFFDPKEQKRYKLNKNTEKLLEWDAICFYKPLPAKKLTILDLLRFGISSWSVADFAYTILLMLIATVMGMLTPKLSHFLYSTVAVGDSMPLLLSTMFFIVCLNLSMLLLNAMRSAFTSRSGVKLDTAVSSAMMMRTLTLPMGFFRQYSSGELLQRIGYAESVCTTLVDMIFSTSLSSLFSLVYITQVFNYAPALGIPALIIILVNVGFTTLTTIRQTKLARRKMEISAKNSGISLSTVSGVQKIRLAGAEERMFARWANAYSQELRMAYNPPMFLRYNSAFARIIALGGSLLLSWLAVKTHVDAPAYAAFQSAYGMVSGAITGLVGIALQAAELKPCLDMARPLLETLPESDDKVVELPDPKGNIEMSHVSFRYSDDSPNIFEDFSLKIRSGEYVAIVGRTGCGKSTLVRLLLGFEKPKTGAIYYDGVDLNKIEKKSLRRRIGTVMQDDKLFMGSIYSNIVICEPRLTLDRAWEAAELAGIADDIREMPMGMHTIISDGQGGISGGQRQRLMIARAIAPKPRILIFDEATSALDNLTQKKVSDALDSLDCTRIVIAHRLSTIRHCDRILVIDNGRIAESGTYEELVALNGVFADLVERQRLDK